MKIFDWIIKLSILIMLALLPIMVHHLSIKKDNGFSSISDTSIFYDTVPFPVPKDSLVLRYESVKLPVSAKVSPPTQPPSDTIIDSIYVDVPITQKKYEDSTYHAVISGYNVNLDTIIVKHHNITNAITKTEIKPTKFGLGLSLGYDPINRRPSVIIGVNYTIFPIK